MKLSEIKNHLKSLKQIAFELPDGSLVPNHFHVTEVGKVTKDFIDCGGKLRHEEVVNFQLWNADDYDHRLHPEKLVHIIELSEKVLNLPDAEIEIEYQGNTIGKYGLDFDGKHFMMTNKATACLARESCGVPEQNIKQENQFVQLTTISAGESCAPGSGCC